MVCGILVQGKMTIIDVTITGRSVPLRLAVGVSVGVILFVVIIFLMLFVLWKRKYPAYTRIERGEDGTGKDYLLAYFDSLLNIRNSRRIDFHKI